MMARYDMVFAKRIEIDSRDATTCTLSLTLPINASCVLGAFVVGPWEDSVSDRVRRGEDDLPVTIVPGERAKSDTLWRIDCSVLRVGDRYACIVACRHRGQVQQDGHDIDDAVDAPVAIDDVLREGIRQVIRGLNDDDVVSGFVL